MYTNVGDGSEKRIWKVGFWDFRFWGLGFSVPPRTERTWTEINEYRHPWAYIKEERMWKYPRPSGQVIGDDFFSMHYGLTYVNVYTWDTDLRTHGVAHSREMNICMHDS